MSRINVSINTASFTRFQAPTGGYYGQGICLGPDGNIWVSDANGYLYNYNIDQTISTLTTYSFSNGIVAMCTGPDGNIWAVDPANKVWKITTGGSRTTYSGITTPSSICVGPDLNLWVSDNTGKVSKVTTSGTITSYSVGSSTSFSSICLGP